MAVSLAEMVKNENARVVAAGSVKAFGSLRKAANALKVSRKFIKTWSSRAAAGQSLKTKSGAGRNPKLNHHKKIL